MKKTIDKISTNCYNPTRLVNGFFQVVRNHVYSFQRTLSLGEGFFGS